MYPRRKNINTDKRKVGGRVVGLFDQSYDMSAASHFGDAELSRVFDLFKQDERIGFLLCKLLHKFLYVPADEIIPEVHNKRGLLKELVCSFNRVGKTRRSVLQDVRYPGVPPLAVSHRLFDLIAGLRRYDDAYVADAGMYDVVDAIKKDGPVCNWNKLLCAGIGQRSESSAPASAKDQGLHAISNIR